MRASLGKRKLSEMASKAFYQGNFDYHELTIQIDDLTYRRIGIETRLQYLNNWLSGLEFRGLKDYEMEYFEAVILNNIELLKSGLPPKFNEFIEDRIANIYYLLMFELRQYTGEHTEQKTYCRYIATQFFNDEKKYQNLYREVPKRIKDLFQIKAGKFDVKQSRNLNERERSEILRISNKYNHKLITDFIASLPPKTID